MKSIFFFLSLISIASYSQCTSIEWGDVLYALQCLGTTIEVPGPKELEDFNNPKLIYTMPRYRGILSAWDVKSMEVNALDITKTLNKILDVHEGRRTKENMRKLTLKGTIDVAQATIAADLARLLREAFYQCNDETWMKNYKRSIR